MNTSGYNGYNTRRDEGQTGRYSQISYTITVKANARDTLHIYLNIYVYIYIILCVGVVHVYLVWFIPYDGLYTYVYVGWDFVLCADYVLFDTTIARRGIPLRAHITNFS